MSTTPVDTGGVSWRAMTIYIVRHGLAASGAEDLDPGLDDLGHQQAQRVAVALGDYSIGRLVVSPMLRCRETIAPLALATGIQPEVREEVSEVFDPAMAADQRRTMIGPFMQGVWSTQPEELLNWRTRCLAATLDLAAQVATAERDLVIVSHYIAICVLIGAATGDDRVVPTPIANASITSFEPADGALRLVAAGDTAHLEPELVTGVNTAMLGKRP